jgi:hypothetical protein
VAKNAVSEWSTTAASNTDIATINIDEGCPPSGINNAIRTMMSQLKSALGMTEKYVTSTGSYTILATDNRTFFRKTGGAATWAPQSAATCGDGWRVTIKVEDNTLTIDPQGAETIDGAATIAIPAGTTVDIWCNGTAFFSSRSGVASSTDNTLPRFDGTAGALQSSGVTVDDNNRMAVGLGVEATPSVAFLGDLNTGMWSPSADVIAWSTAGSENLRLSGMALMLGTTTITGLSDGSAVNVGAYMGDGVFAAQNNAGAALYLSKRSATGSLAEFYVTGAYVGGITVTGAATTFATSSDYRLKDDVENLADSGQFIEALRPVTYRWTATGEQATGFLAHEFGAVSPSSVHGEKDAVDGDGKPIYQALDASTPEVIANIVAELQSLRRRVAELEA